MKFHFLNVGHGDCTFIELPSGRLMMIDINNSKSLNREQMAGLAHFHGMSLHEFQRPGSYELGRSWEDYYESLLVDPVEYYKENFANRQIFRYVQTHPDMDHMSGLDRFFFQERIPLLNFWDVSHTKDVDETEFENGEYDYNDWEAYKSLRRGIRPRNLVSNIETESVTVINNTRMERGKYWSEDAIEVLSPSKKLLKEENEKEEWNNLSYVLRFEYAGRSVVLGGDAVQEAWDSMLDELPSEKLNCDLLKAAHHGRKSGYHAESVNAMSPDVTICSVGKKPETDAHDEYKRHGCDVYSTRAQGTITATISNDGSMVIKNAAGELLSEKPAKLTLEERLMKQFYG